MNELDTPVLDDHLHLDPVNGRGVDAAEEFADHGGTHLLVLNKPSWNLLDGPATAAADFRDAFELTIQVTREADAVLEGRAWPVLGVHPAIVSQLVESGYTPEGAGEIMRSGLDVAAEFVADGPALALKSGRPHYDVSEAIWAESNATIRHAFDLAGEVGCAVQLHTETTEDLTEVSEWASECGLPGDSVVKHFAGGRLAGPIKSVIARKDALRTAIDVDEPFLMETDFIDDPERPGAVLGPKTVPRRVRWLLQEGHEAAVRRAHVETPATVYGIDTEATLTE